MARPEMQEHEKRTERHNLRFTLAEHEHIRAQAEAVGLSVAEFLRRRALGYMVPTGRARRRVDPGVLNELNRIGVNVNQIARNLNSDRPLRLNAQEVLSELQQVLGRLASLDDYSGDGEI